jgi:cyclopropane fatty-acyl-phospholipid synthase-like methyltransferase
MKSIHEGFGYNERLFSGGVRAFFHLARFRWFQNELQRRGIMPRKVLELGCFDGKVLRFLPQPPQRYVGFDANWESGLDLARRTFATQPQFEFHEATSPADLRLAPEDQFDVIVTMETLEHLPPEDLDAYLAKLATHAGGWVFVTVPNEKGPLFLAKWLAKRIFSRDGEAYTGREVLYATLGLTHKVARNQHKGFDYDVLVSQLRRHFDIVKVSGHPLTWLPTFLCFSVGIVAVPKKNAAH